VGIRRSIERLLGCVSGGTAAVDLTPLWLAAHPHLRPIERRLAPHPADDRGEPCPLCGEERAVRVGAHLGFGEHGVLPDASVLHCESCRRFLLPGADLDAHRRALGPSARGAGVASVDARLWSRAPVVLNIEPTTRCNFKCWYCVGRRMKQEDLAIEDFRAALDHFPGLRVLALVGEGEPLLHKDFFEMVRLAKDRGIRVVTLSNGSLFGESMALRLCDSGIDYVSVSIDSIDPGRFAESRIGGDLDRVWGGVERLRAIRDARGSRYPILGLRGTLFERTRREMPAIIEEAKQRGIEVVEGFQPLNPKRSYVEIYPADKAALLGDVSAVQEAILSGYACSALPGVDEIAAREEIPIGNAGRPNPWRRNCDEEWIYSLLSGDVTPCCQIKNPVSPRWNLFRHSIAEILSDEEYENTRFNLWNGFFPSMCEGCWKTR